MDLNTSSLLRAAALVGITALLSLSTADAQQSRSTTTTSVTTRPAAGTTLRTCVSIKAPGYTATRLDSLQPLYRPGHGDETCVFPVEKGGEYSDAWMGFVGGLLELMPPDAMSGGAELGLFAFFAADGSLEHFFYSIPGSEEKGVAAAIENYAREYRFPMKGGERFKQCGSIGFETQVETQ